MKMTRTIPAFPVHNIEEAVEFYEAKFGFNCVHKDQGFALLMRGDAELHLWAACDNSWKLRGASLIERPVLSGAESFIAGTHGCRIEVAGIDELFAELAPKGVLHSPTTVVETTAWGTREFPAVDLHGNLITFFEEQV